MNGSTNRAPPPSPYPIILTTPLPKTYIISFGDLELGLKIEFLVFISRKNSSSFMKHVFTVWIFNTIISYNSFLVSKTGLCI
jgi:hypothetical protein